MNIGGIFQSKTNNNNSEHWVILREAVSVFTLRHNLTWKRRISLFLKRPVRIMDRRLLNFLLWKRTLRLCFV